MGNYTTEDLQRLAGEIRDFLDVGDWRRRVLGMAKLYLEMPDVGAMYALQKDILMALGPAMRACEEPMRIIDEETIELPFGGISIILTCRQRFMTRDHKPVGYASLNFVETPMPWRDENGE